MATKKQTDAPEAPAQEPVEEQSSALATAETTTGLATFEEDSQQFSDDFQREDFAMPFLQVLQSNSPIVKEGGAKYVEGAKASQFFLTTSKDLFDGIKVGIRVAPVKYERKFIEWRLREVGGGFVKDHGLAGGLDLIKKCTRDDKGRFLVPKATADAKQTQLVETMQYLVLLITDEGSRASILALTSTQLKKGRGWNTSIDELRVEGKNGKKVRPPMFAMVYNITTIAEQNGKGEWYGVKILPDKLVSELGQEGDSIYQEAKKLRSSIDAGEINLSAAPPPEDADHATEEAAPRKNPF